jgi:hypothetical protein
MAKGNNINISDELLAAYLEGNTTSEETMQVLRALEQDELLNEILITSERVDSMSANSKPEYTLLPMGQLAAKAKDNLCDLQCEEYILSKLNIDFDVTDLSEEARENKWLKDKGTPLHSVGRLLEQKGLSVVRRYNASNDDLLQAIDSKCNIIVIVNADKLIFTEDKKQLEDEISYHAIVLLDYNSAKNSVSVYDPATQNGIDKYSLDQFRAAWEDALCFMVTAQIKTSEIIYNPQPIDLNDIDLSEDLLELREAIAENAHDVWAAARIKEGWTYGAVRDDKKKKNPDMVPYADLPDSEKQYDRDMALNTIKLVRKLGYDLIKTTNTELYKSLIGKLRQQEELFHCNECGAPIFKDQVYCEQCGKKLDYSDYYD